MEPREDKNGFYTVLGVPKHASTSEIRNAYRKLAMKWHPDKCRGEQAKKIFQEIQEAYSVLSDEGKRSLYDLGLYDSGDEDEDVQGMNNFLDEMSAMMMQVKAENDKVDTLEDLQRLFVNMFAADLEMYGFSMPGTAVADPYQRFMKRDQKKKRDEFFEEECCSAGISVTWSDDEWAAVDNRCAKHPRTLKKRRACAQELDSNAKPVTAVLGMQQPRL